MIPCAVWYAHGERQVNAAVANLNASAHREAVASAEQAATRLALRLEDLRRAEEDRSHLHYFPEFLVPGRHCSKRGGTGTDQMRRKPSPLVKHGYPRGIALYFQVDRRGAIHTPRVEDLSDLVLPYIPPVPRRPFGHAHHGGPLPTTVQPWLTFNAPTVYAALDGLSPRPPSTEDDADAGPMRWVTGMWRGKPILAALRTVRLNDQDLHQGFALDNATVATWVSAGDLSGRLIEGKAQVDTDARVPIEGGDWFVSVDAARAKAKVRQQETYMRRQFRGSYLMGLAGAMLAGSCVLALVFRSGKMARDRSRFAAAAAHELRTPLAGIRLHGEMLAAALGKPESIKRYAQRITDEAERLGRVVANVLNYTRDDQRRLTIKPQSGDLAGTLRRALATMEPLMAENGARLVIRIDEPLPDVAFDADAIHQMLQNLIDNAEKYARNAENRDIEVTAEPDGVGGVALSVRDHGPGVSPHLRPRLFQPFANADTPARPAGLGLGLSVVHALAAGHGGTVDHEDAVGGGTVFVVRLPGA
jgi:signal transduction histidine kinase